MLKRLYSFHTVQSGCKTFGCVGVCKEKWEGSTLDSPCWYHTKDNWFCFTTQARILKKLILLNNTHRQEGISSWHSSQNTNLYLRSCLKIGVSYRDVKTSTFRLFSLDKLYHVFLQFFFSCKHRIFASFGDVRKCKLYVINYE